MDSMELKNTYSILCAKKNTQSIASQRKTENKLNENL